MARPHRPKEAEDSAPRPPSEAHETSGGDHPGERLAAIVNSLDVIIWEFDATELSTTYVSPQIEQMLGYTVDEVYEEPNLWKELLHPDDRERVVDTCLEHTRHGRSHQLEYRMLEAGGEVRWVRDIATYVPCDGEPDRLRCVFIDITERKEAVLRLEENRERLAVAQRIAHVGDWQWDLETDEIEWSDECYRIFGLAPQSMELTYDKFLSLLPEESVPEIEATAVRLLESGDRHAMNQYFVLPTGEPRILHAEIEVMRDEDGTPYKVRGTVQDVTELRRVEALHRRLGRILEHSSTEVLVFDAESLQITRANQASRHNLEYSADELEELSILDVLPSSPRRRFEQRLCEVREEGRDVVRFDTSAKRSDGSKYPVSVQLLYSGLDLEPVFVAIIEDTSTREEVDRLKDAFLGLVSHELRTPLTPLDGLLEVMKREIDADEQPRLRRMVELAHSNTHRLLEVVNNLLDLRRLTSEEGIELERRPCDLREAIDDSIAENQALFFGRSLSYALGLPEEPLCTRVDRRRIVQVLTNLISNAAKFSKPGGRVEINLVRDEGQAEIQVRDYGEGIAEEFQPYVFDKFTQAHTPMERSYQGTGLGLALSRKLVEMHDGDISFETALGEGTTFFVRLPLT
ncbi:sensor histidine kinase [Persicimonas caeni]|nr:PAS domain-containing sensor histidine kinase [Persicimonas caeni]